MDVSNISWNSERRPNEAFWGGRGKGGLPTQLVNLFPDHRLRRSLESIAAEECWDQRSTGESRVSNTPPKSKAY